MLGYVVTTLPTWTRSLFADLYILPWWLLLVCLNDADVFLSEKVRMLDYTNLISNDRYARTSATVWSHSR
jgi:hypothetical protein